MNETIEQRIFNCSRKLYNMAPWKYMLETDVFGIKIPGKNKIYFVSIMGSAREMFAISAYEGDIGLQMFWELQEKNSGLQPWAIFDIPHMMLSFQEKYTAESDRLNIFLPEGVNTDQEFVPVLDKVVPGLVYFPPEGTDLDDFLVILEQSAEILERASEDKYFLMPEGFDDDEYLVRESRSYPSGEKWSDFYRKIPPRNIFYSRKYSEGLLTNLLSIRKTNDIYQIDLVMLPSPVLDKGPKGYFAYALLITNSETGAVDGCKLLTPFPNLHSMQESVPEQVLKLLNRMTRIPRTMEIRTALLDALLTSFLKKAGIEIRKVNKLESIDNAVNSLVSHFNRSI